jgi:hypothetical protein
MKKLLLVLMVVAIAAFLLVGCIPGVTPTPTPTPTPGVEICPTVSVTSQAAVGGKTYIKGGKQTITVTFAVPTAPVSVYVGPSISSKALPVGVPEEAAEVVMHTTDNKVYTGTYIFTGDCDEDYIYVLTCDTCSPCKYPYTVDTDKPFIGQVEICVEDCTCAGCGITFTSGKTPDCDPCDPTVYCGDCCSGFASWSVQIYNKNPFDVCCDTPCVEPIDEGTGTCQVDFTTTCLEESSATPGERTVYALVTTFDNVGNKTKMLTTVTVDPDSCDTISIKPIYPGGVAYDCVDTPEFVKCTVID